MKKELMYHYCSVESMFNILTSKALWLSDSIYMNDEFESVWIDNIVFDVFEKLRQKNIKKQIKYYKKLKTKKNYIMCFSEKKDLLSQWRGYGDDGKGVIISFSKNHFLHKTYGVCSGKSTTPKFGLEKVIYNPHDEIKTAINTLRHNKELQIIKDMSSRVKHSTFEEEQEIRLTFTPDNNMQLYKSLYDKKLQNLSDKKFRIKNDNIVCYYEYDFKSDLKFIDSIILGPKCLLDKKNLMDFFKMNGYCHLEIKKSKLSYK